MVTYIFINEIGDLYLWNFGVGGEIEGIFKILLNIREFEKKILKICYNKKIFCLKRQNISLLIKSKP